jgi:hypothetical protein
VQGLSLFRSFPYIERRSSRSREPVAAARLYLDRLLGERPSVHGRVGAAILVEGPRVIAGAGLKPGELSGLAEAARAVVAQPQSATSHAGPASPVARAPGGDLYVHRIMVRGREHLFATLGGRARRVREVQRDLARIFSA